MNFDEMEQPAETIFCLLIEDYDRYDVKRMLDHITDIHEKLSTSNKWSSEFFIKPVSIECFKFQKTETKKRLFSKKTKEIKVSKYAYLLHFGRKLTVDEINTWKMFKIGFFTGLFQRICIKYTK